MMQVTMISNRKGSEDGFAVKQFNKGETYELVDSLACEFLREGDAVSVNYQPKDLGYEFAAIDLMEEVHGRFGRPIVMYVDGKRKAISHDTLRIWMRDAPLQPELIKADDAYMNRYGKK